MTIEQLNEQAQEIKQLGRELQSSLDVIERANKIRFEKEVKSVCATLAPIGISRADG